ncbi:MAG: NACHT domain-containing protein [Actinomadura sp.]
MVAEQWKVEAALRSLDDPDPIPVQWRLTARGEIMDHRVNIAPDTLRLTGSSSQIAALVEQFRALRRRRLVILGGPGSGKTTLAVQLLRELLNSQRDDEPVPVLLSVASWDVRAFPRLQDWLILRLGQDYPALHSPGLGTDLPRRLVARGHILPVLDGLDELPDAARVMVITALNRSLGDDQLILTSRIKEFTAAIRAAGDVLTSAAVIEPLPLAPAAAADYLRFCLPSQPGPVWEQILTRLRTPALAETVSTPLGLWLLRTTYVTPGADPTPLLWPGWSPRTASLRAHLFDQLIPALIATRPPSADPNALFQPRRSHNPHCVRQWLGFLAHHLNQLPTENDQTGTRDFAWWQLARHTLPPHASRLVFGLVGGVVSGLMCGLIFWLSFALETGFKMALRDGLYLGLTVGPIFAVTFGFAFGLTGSSWLRELPGFTNLHLAGRATLTRLIRDGLTSGLANGLKGGLALWLAIVLGSGLIEGLNGLEDGLDALVAAAKDELVLTNGLVFGLTGGLVYGLIHWIETPATADHASTPMITWQADRSLNLFRIIAVGLAGWLVIGLTLGLVAGPVYGLVIGLAGGLALGLVGLAAGRHHAWLAYLAATYRLALSRHLPRQLMPFLDDAHRLGLLRAVGPIYQFRHAELQDHLAATYRSCRQDAHTDVSSTAPIP